MNEWPCNAKIMLGYSKHRNWITDSLMVFNNHSIHLDMYPDDDGS